MEIRRTRISEICKALGLSYEGSDCLIDGLNLCNRDSEQSNLLSYVTSNDYVEDVNKRKAIKALVLPKEFAGEYGGVTAKIYSDDAENTFYDIHESLYANGFYEAFTFPAHIADSAVIDESAVVQNGVIIGENVNIGANTVVRKGTVIKDGCNIGCNCTIGSEGFQVIRTPNGNRKIPHAGGVLIEDGVFVSDNCTVANSLFEGATRIGKGVMIDDLCHIGHNSFIQDYAVITAGTTLCGSSYIKDYAWIGAGSVQLNRTTVGSHAKIGVGSVIVRDVPDGRLAYGSPARVKPRFNVGMSGTYSRQITDEDVRLFADVSGDNNPIHIDDKVGMESIFGGRVVHGALCSSLISTVIGTKMPGNGTVYLGQNIRYVKPVYINDMLTVKVTIAEMLDKGNARLKTTVENQDGVIVIEGEAFVKLPA